MIIQFMTRDARPTGGIWTVEDVVKRFSQKAPFRLPILIRGVATEKCAREFDSMSDRLPWGSVAVFPDLDSRSVAASILNMTLERAQWRQWTPAGCERHETMFVRSHYDGGTYATHQRYLIEAVRLTDGPVLELGAGEGSTSILHQLVCANPFTPGRRMITVDNSETWLAKYAHLNSADHLLIFKEDPAACTWLDEKWGVVFVDHAPGNTRKNAIWRARDKADYVVVHDTEDCGYDVWDDIESFKFKRTFRYMRPWTSVCSMKREIFDDPYGQE